MREWKILEVENGYILICRSEATGVMGKQYVFNSAKELADWISKYLEEDDV